MQKTEDSHEVVVMEHDVAIKEEPVEIEIDNMQNVVDFVNKPVLYNNKVISYDENSHISTTSSNARHGVNKLAMAIYPTTEIQTEYNIKNEIYFEILPNNEVDDNFIDSNGSLQVDSTMVIKTECNVKDEMYFEISPKNELDIDYEIDSTTVIKTESYTKDRLFETLPKNEFDENFIESNDLTFSQVFNGVTINNTKIDCLEKVEEYVNAVDIKIPISSKCKKSILKGNMMKSLKSVTTINESDITKRNYYKKVSAPIAQQHSEERPYPCDQCGKAYATRYNLKRHNRTVHEHQVHIGRRSFSCDICDKVFQTKFNIQRHITRVHTEARPYQCEQCDMAFKTQQNLKGHQNRVHLRERPFSCDICTKMFKTKSDIQVHIKMVHSKVRPYPCKQCGMAFKSLCNLKCHQQWTHMVDSSSQSYTCEQCGKTFKRQIYFKKHQRVHTDKYLFTCDFCNIEYRYKAGLQKHIITSHMNMP